MWMQIPHSVSLTDRWFRKAILNFTRQIKLNAFREYCFLSTSNFSGTLLRGYCACHRVQSGPSLRPARTVGPYSYSIRDKINQSSSINRTPGPWLSWPWTRNTSCPPARIKRCPFGIKEPDGSWSLLQYFHPVFLKSRKEDAVTIWFTF